MFTAIDYAMLMRGIIVSSDYTNRLNQILFNSLTLSNSVNLNSNP